jgi:uncharacterized SAM-binding protein YcdF (DUF218 family)
MSALLKSVEAIVAAPLVLAILIAVAGAIVRRHPPSRRFLLVCAVVVAYLGSISIVGDALIRSLESRYPPLGFDHPASQTVVVLGSGFRPHDGVPITAALDPDGLIRIAEGVRLAMQMPSVELVVSGGAPAGEAPPAQGYAELARALGIADSRLVVLSSPRNTAEEARAIAQRMGNKPFFLVTSAYHMPRAIRQMQRAGAAAIPAPTGQLTGSTCGYGWRSWIPNSDGLGKTERALHEYLGLLAFNLGFG